MDDAHRPGLRKLFRRVETQDAYAALSVRARQAAALVAFARWRRRVGLVSEDLDGLEAHLWAWMDVDETVFDDWYRYDSDALGAALGADMAPLLKETTRVARVSETQLRRVLESLVEITYGDLFGRVDNKRSLLNLRALTDITSQAGVTAPPPLDFISSPFEDYDGWGRPKVDEVAAWRALSKVD